MTYHGIGVKVFTLFFSRTLFTSFAYFSADTLMFLFSLEWEFFRGLPT